MTYEEMDTLKQCMAKVAEKNFMRVKDKLLDDTEMPLMERKAMMSIAKSAATLMTFSMTPKESSYERSWTKI